jgi:hypothetical protein
MTEQSTYAFSDDAIAAIVRVLQFGLLSGIDITDHFRAMRLSVNDEQMIVPDEQWLQNFEQEVISTNEAVISRAQEAGAQVNEG